MDLRTYRGISHPSTYISMAIDPKIRLKRCSNCCHELFWKFKQDHLFLVQGRSLWTEIAHPRRRFDGGPSHPHQFAEPEENVTPSVPSFFEPVERETVIYDRPDDLRFLSKKIYWRGNWIGTIIYILIGIGEFLSGMAIIEFSESNYRSNYMAFLQDWHKTYLFWTNGRQDTWYT